MAAQRRAEEVMPERPSQAEGDRQTVEQDLREQSSGQRESDQPGAAQHAGEHEREARLHKPSQAEGTRQTVEQDLRDKGLQGDDRARDWRG